MKKLMLLSAFSLMFLASCVSKKEHVALQEKYQESQDLLNTATVKLNSCLSDAAAANARVETMKDQLSDLRKANQDLIDTKGNLTTLTQKGAENLERSLESLKERDLKITRLQDALTKKDSVTLAIVTSLKKAVGINDPDIEINVEKGVVFISIADKLLFQSGSYNVTNEAKNVLAKVAKVVNSKPDFEAMVESHTDNVPYNKPPLIDNWDLSAKRATSVVRVLEDLDVNPKQLIAAARSYYVPLVDNDTASNRAKNRRTRIVVMPKIDQFYQMVEEEMKNLAEGN
ncbi:OmpA/MotB family protein [Winogradskyella bathintestinalis]|uniref:OmpA family protein n=1 Tax=Winogradskyella bathintestinalis TaxID=3035208 RepID=A0ABT7ZYI2_9FLAO|nr:OmpA family protein [Winogradskyella bathintestinalis]MDN3494044.1 OmpA family protein [Winogradskyella bathintestinalis]